MRHGVVVIGPRLLAHQEKTEEEQVEQLLSLVVLGVVGRHRGTARAGTPVADDHDDVGNAAEREPSTSRVLLQSCEEEEMSP